MPSRTAAAVKIKTTRSDVLGTKLPLRIKVTVIAALHKNKVLESTRYGTILSISVEARMPQMPASSVNRPRSRQSTKVDVT